MSGEFFKSLNISEILDWHIYLVLSCMRTPINYNVMKRIVLLSLIILSSVSSLYCQISDTLITGTLIDNRDGHEYKWVKIGDQVWMAENLNYMNSSGSWVYKKDTSMAIIYGRLYNWEIALQVCPAGWHLPREAEWTKLRPPDPPPGGQLITSFISQTENVVN